MDALARELVATLPTDEGLVVIDVAMRADVVAAILAARRAQMAPVVSKQTDRIWAYAYGQGDAIDRWLTTLRDAGFRDHVRQAMAVEPRRAAAHWAGPLDILIARDANQAADWWKRWELWRVAPDKGSRLTTLIASSARIVQISHEKDAVGNPFDELFGEAES